MSQYFDELKRRNVFRVGAAYAVVGWLVIEVVDTLAPRMAMPDWVPGFFIILILIGFPIALLFSWAFEMTPEGIKKTAEVDASESITTTTGQKINYIMIAALAAVVLLQQFSPSLRTITSFGDEARDAPITIAVLPFADLSADGDQEYLGDGVAEEILNVLASTDGLKVTSRTSAFAFKGQSLSIPQIASLLGVTHVVEGSIRKQGDQVRITGQLIEVADDSHLWSDTFDADLSDIFRLQDEIAGNISSALSERLGLQLPSATREMRNWDIAAYELYLRARQLVLAREDYETAITLLDTALQIEPEFADAWAEKGSALALRAYGLGLEDETVAEAYVEYDVAWVAASRATEISSGHQLGTAVLGLVRLNQMRFIEARVLLERAMSQPNPNDNTVLWYAILKALTGDMEGALVTLDAGLESSPTAPNLLRWRAFVLSYMGRWQEVWDERTSTALAGDMRQTAIARLVAGLMIGEIGAAEIEAWVEADSVEVSAGNMAIVIETIYAIESGTECDGSNEQLDVLWNTDDYILASVVSKACPELVAEMLKRGAERILNVPNRNELTEYWVPGIGEFRASPLVHDILSELGLPAYWDLYGWPDACRRTAIDDFVCE